MNLIPGGLTIAFEFLEVFANIEGALQIGTKQPILLFADLEFA
jgi:hypothetical protein